MLLCALRGHCVAILNILGLAYPLLLSNLAPASRTCESLVLYYQKYTLKECPLSQWLVLNYCVECLFVPTVLPTVGSCDIESDIEQGYRTGRTCWYIQLWALCECKSAGK